MAELKWRRRPNDAIELRLPLIPEYLPVLRATMGVAAGVMGFNYADIMQLRVAISEVFDLAVKHVGRGNGNAEVDELAVRFSDYPGKIEILVLGPRDYTGYLNGEDGKESLLLLRSLMDEIEFGVEAASKTVIRMVMHKSLTGEI